MLLFAGLSVTVLRTVEVDEKTGCPLGNHAPDAHTVILIDETDKLAPDDLNYLKTLVMNEYHWLPLGGRLTVRSIVSNPDEARDIVVCRMDNGEGVLGIGKNPKKVRQDFDRIAGKKLNQLFEDLKTAPPQEASPILEFISAVFDRPNFGPNVETRRLVVFSDMAQFSDLATHYGRRDFRLKEAAKDELRRDMSGVQIRLQYVTRRSLAAIQTQAHRNFWTNYVRSMGAEDVDLGRNLLVGEETSRDTWSDNE